MHIERQQKSEKVKLAVYKEDFHLRAQSQQLENVRFNKMIDFDEKKRPSSEKNRNGQKGEST